MTTTGPEITAETLETLKAIPTQTLIDGLWVMGWPMSFIHGAKPLQPGPTHGRPGSDAPVRAAPT